MPFFIPFHVLLMMVLLVLGALGGLARERGLLFLHRASLEHSSRLHALHGGSFETFSASLREMVVDSALLEVVEIWQEWRLLFFNELAHEIARIFMLFVVRSHSTLAG